MKKCKTCKELKSLNSFNKNRVIKGGYSHHCKKCSRKKYAAKDYCSKEYRKKASIKFRENNYELNMLLATKSSAKKRNLDFDLTIDDIIIPEYCPYLKIRITKIIGKGKVVSNPSFDRIDNRKGYIKGMFK